MIYLKTVKNAIFYLFLQKQTNMKLKLILTCLLIISLMSCKKDEVDGTNQQAFQESVNDMASDLSTIKQYKFNEALYVIKTFGVNTKGERAKMKELAELLQGKKTDEIFAMADQLAQQNNYDWSSKGTPSMGEMNIFQNLIAAEYDPNDIKASGISIDIQPRGATTTQEANGLQIIPYLVDAKDQKIIFDKAGLETVFEILSNGVQVYRSRSIIMSNNYTGLNLAYNKLNKKLIIDELIDIRVSIVTTSKTHRFLKSGIRVNPDALYTPSDLENTPKSNPIADTVSLYQPTTNPNTEATTTVLTNENTSDTPKPTLSPKAQLSLFLNNLSSKNFKSAYEKSQNNNWGSYDNFANTNSGFGAIQSLEVQSIKMISENDNSAQYETDYKVTDKNGNQTKVKCLYELKLIKNQWKISNYKIISNQ